MIALVMERLPRLIETRATSVRKNAEVLVLQLLLRGFSASVREKAGSNGK
jgi:hypothetical protein